MVYLITDKEQPNSVEHMFRGCLRELDVELKPLFLLARSNTICWSLWLGRNDLNAISFMHVIHMATYLLLRWAMLQGHSCRSGP